MVKTKNKYNALVDGYFAKLEEPNNENEIVKLFREHERAKFVELTKEQGVLEKEYIIAKNRVQQLVTRRSSGCFGWIMTDDDELAFKQKIVEQHPGKIKQKKDDIKQITERLDDQEYFRYRALECKREYQSYQESKDYLASMASELNEQESKEIQIGAQQARIRSTVDLKKYLKDQVRLREMMLFFGTQFSNLYT